MCFACLSTVWGGVLWLLFVWWPSRHNTAIVCSPRKHVCFTSHQTPWSIRTHLLPNRCCRTRTARALAVHVDQAQMCTNKKSSPKILRISARSETDESIKIAKTTQDAAKNTSTAVPHLSHTSRREQRSTTPRPSLFFLRDKQTQSRAGDHKLLGGCGLLCDAPHCGRAQHKACVQQVGQRGWSGPHASLVHARGCDPVCSSPNHT